MQQQQPLLHWRAQCCCGFHCSCDCCTAHPALLLLLVRLLWPLLVVAELSVLHLL
jgi:hypothetical protein